MAESGTPLEGGWKNGLEALRQGRVEDAVMQLSAFVQASPNSFEGNHFLGIALAQAGRHQEAIHYLQQATRLNPQSAQAYYNLGLACMGAGQNDMALMAFQTALQINPNYTQAQRALALLPAPIAETPAWKSPPPAEQTAAPISPAPLEAEALAPEPTPAAMPITAVPSSADITGIDVLKATVCGVIAAVVGAFIWDKFVYWTNIQFGLIAAGIGILVGIAVSIGAGGKRGIALQIIGALLALIGMLLGWTLIGMDVIKAELAKKGESTPFPILFLVSATLTPIILIKKPINLLFIAIGVYEGWKIPSRSKT